MGQLRISGGIYRSRLIKFNPQNITLRPTPDMVRQTLFNWLEQDLTGKICLDLFAGSGILGFEAVSRGALHVVCVEKHYATYKNIQLEQQRLAIDNLTIIRQDVLQYLKNCPLKFDVIFIDPPYTSELLNQSLRLINLYKLLNTCGKIYVEYNTMPNLDGYTMSKQGIVGMVHYALLHQS